MNQTTAKKPSDMKSMHVFTNIFDVEKRTAICCVGAEKKRRAIKSGISLWTKEKRKGQ